MKMKLKIESHDAALTDDPQGETVRILRELADKIETRGLDDYPVRDINGNAVGKFEVLA
jgi:hypothetical protein